MSLLTQKDRTKSLQKSYFENAPNNPTHPLLRFAYRRKMQCLLKNGKLTISLNIFYENSLYWLKKDLEK